MRLNRHVIARSLFQHQLLPVFHAIASLFEKTSIRLSINEPVQCGDRGFCVTNQTNIDRVPQTNAIWFVINLDGLGLTRFWQKLHIRKRRPNDHQGITIFHCILRRSGPEQTQTAGRQRMIIRDNSLSEQSFHDWGAKTVGKLDHFFAGAKCALTDKYDRLRCVVD